MRIFLMCLGLCLANLAYSQNNLKPVTWEFTAEKIADDTYVLHYDATIDDNWMVYSQHIGPDGPVPTSFRFTIDGFEELSKVQEPDNAERNFDKMFEMELIKFKKTANFTQTIKASPGQKITGLVRFMCCDGKRCLAPQEIPFEFVLE